MTRPIPPHGTEGRYSGTATRPGCRCPKCKLALKQAAYRRERNRALYGGSLISRELLMEHVAVLMGAGMNLAAIAKNAGVSPATLSYLTLGKVNSCRRSVALRILQVRPGSVVDAEHQPALPIRRRVQALYAVGHGATSISDAIGCGTSTIHQIAHGHYEQVEREVAAAIRGTYHALAATPGPSVKARAVARRRGWPDPTWWEDWGGIDDPSAPETEPAAKRGARAEAHYRAEEIRHLAYCGASYEEIAARLSTPSQRVTAKYVQDVATGTRAPGWRQQQREAA